MMLPPPSVLHPRTWVSQKPAGGGSWEAWSPSARGTGQVQWGGSRSSRHTREAVRIHGEQEHRRQHDLLIHVLLLMQGSSEDLRFFPSPTCLGSKLVSFFTNAGHIPSFCRSLSLPHSLLLKTAKYCNVSCQSHNLSFSPSFSP